MIELLAVPEQDGIFQIGADEILHSGMRESWIHHIMELCNSWTKLNPQILPSLISLETKKNTFRVNSYHLLGVLANDITEVLIAFRQGTDLQRYCFKRCELTIASAQKQVESKVCLPSPLMIWSRKACLMEWLCSICTYRQIIGYIRQLAHGSMDLLLEVGLAKGLRQHHSTNQNERAPAD